MRQTTRYGSLDGLRGVAALVVLAHHALLTLPAFSEAFWRRAHLQWPLALLDGTPLHLVWAGPEAVFVFFVLSGLVLGLAARAPRFAWMPYYPSRLVRLYLPVIAAVIVVAPLLIWSPGTPPHASAWVRAHSPTYGLGNMLHDMTLVDGISGVITPLWSLKWEVVFSLMLPIYIVAIRRKHLGWEVPLLIAVATLGAAKSNGPLTYLPMFALGVAMAASWETLEQRLARPPGGLAAMVWAITLLIAVALITSGWVAYGLGLSIPDWTLLPFKLVGVCILVLGSAFAPGLRTALGSRTGRLLGAVSFSLYLVHEPILVFFARLVRDPVMALGFALPTIAIVTVVFWMLIEKKAHSLAHRIRSRLASASPEDTPADAAINP